jgi:hypothetical protein
VCSSVRQLLDRTARGISALRRNPYDEIENTILESRNLSRLERLPGRLEVAYKEGYALLGCTEEESVQIAKTGGISKRKFGERSN